MTSFTGKALADLQGIPTYTCDSNDLLMHASPITLRVENRKRVTFLACVKGKRLGGALERKERHVADLLD